MSVKNSAAEFLCRVRVLNYKLMCNDILTKCRSVLKIFYRFYIFPYISYTRLLFIVSFFLYLSHDWYIFHQNAKKKNFHQRSRITNSILLSLYSGLISVAHKLKRTANLNLPLKHNVFAPIYSKRFNCTWSRVARRLTKPCVNFRLFIEV